MKALRHGYRYWQEVLLLCAVFSAPVWEVRSEVTDHFLIELENERVDYFHPQGGVQTGLEGDQTVDYWNLPEVVLPGQVVHSSLGYTIREGNNPNAVVYKTILADWAPDSPIAVLEEGELEGPSRPVRKEFSFTAPGEPGLYRLRLAMTWAFRGIQGFYGDGPHGDSWTTGVGPYAEVWLWVRDPGVPDYFLTEFDAGNVQYYHPQGGVQVGPEGDQSVDFWNIPEVVSPGQVVHSSLGYTIREDNNPNAVVYKTVLADWGPEAPIAILEDGELEGSPRSVRKEFNFIAPSEPGRYRLRLAMTWAFRGIQSFYGDGPHGDAFTTGVGDYAEVWLKVQEPVMRDYFLEEYENQLVEYYNPQGGRNVGSEGEQAVDYWNVPEVVRPNQTVHSSLGYTIREFNNPNAVVYKTVHADWAPTAPIAVLEHGELEGPARSVRREFSFPAPSEPGWHRLRLAMTWAFRGIENFYGDGPHGDSFSTGVGPYSEKWILVGDGSMHRISGSVVYAGPQQGPIYVVAVGSNPSGNNDLEISLNQPGPYLLLDLPAMETYSVYAYRDTNQNHVMDPWEAQATAPSGALTLTEDIAGLNLTLTDPDIDEDTLPDWWEHEHFKSIEAYDETGNPDGDRYQNAEELANQTDPNQFDVGPVAIASAVAIMWESVHEVEYQVQWASAAETDTWQALGEPVSGTGDTMYVFDSARDRASKIYRVVHIE